MTLTKPLPDDREALSQTICVTESARHPWQGSVFLGDVCRAALAEKLVLGGYRITPFWCRHVKWV